MEVYPVLLNTKFIVSAADPAGLGIVPSSLVGGGIQSVYMHSTAATPSSLNPAAGLIMIQLTDPYAKVLNMMSTMEAPYNYSSYGTPTTSTSTTAHVTNIIQSLGTATLAQWQAVGLPVGAVPAVGLAFIATSTASIGGSATVSLVLPAGSGITNIELVQQPSLTVSQRVVLSPQQPIGQSVGGYVIARCMKNSTLTQPNDGTVIDLSLLLSNSSVTVKGE